MVHEALREIEYRLLCQAVREACALMADDQPSAGYRLLNSGLERAKEFAEGGEPWAGDLAASYRAAIFYYACLYPASHRIAMRTRPRA